MKSQNKVKGLLLILGVAMAMPTLALADVSSVTMTPTSVAPAYIRTNSTPPEQTVTLNCNVTVDRTDQVVDRQISILTGTAYETTINPATKSAPVPLTFSESFDVVAPATTPEGLYTARVRYRQPATGGWDSEVLNIDAVMVDNTAPTSTISTPSDGDTICVGTLVSITGTADDPTSNGVASGVASVAVNVDSTSLIVTGTTSWSAEWTPDTPGIYTITSVATDNAGNVQSTVTSITVEVVECEECAWEDETAWADGERYVAQGNWATYTPYAGEELDVTLYAGQTMDAGTVHFSAPVDNVVTITITLNAGWRFADVAENVKIQDYMDAPSGNPSPGLFDWKGYATGSSFSIDVPANNFYGVHVDVEWEDCE
ncbi:MAG: Ig-like domain-containing protein [Planctomycetota bacterium]